MQRANAGRFREPVRLQDGNAKHQEKLLRLRGERRGTADQRAQVRAETFSNLSKDERAPNCDPEGVECAAAPDMLPLPGGASFRKQGANDRTPFSTALLNAAPATLHQRGNIQEIVR